MNALHYPRLFIAIGGLLMGLWGQWAHAQVIDLVSAAEMQASIAAGPIFEPKSVPVKDAPVIEVLAPDVANAVPSPTPIEVKFLPATGAKIRTDSFKVQYGAFKLDVTKRLLGVANVTQEGVQVKQATLPKGKHTLYVTIEDDSGRQNTQRIEFAVN